MINLNHSFLAFRATFKVSGYLNTTEETRLRCARVLKRPENFPWDTLKMKSLTHKVVTPIPFPEYQILTSVTDIYAADINVYIYTHISMYIYMCVYISFTKPLLKKNVVWVKLEFGQDSV